MSVLHLLAAPVSVAAGGYELGTGRTVPTVAALVALTSVVLGWLAVRSASRTGNRRARPIVSLAAGLISVVVGGLHGANAAGGLGTGNGLAGAIIAVALGLAGMVLGWLALARSRATG